MGRLIEFVAACFAVGGGTWKGYLAYLRFRKKYRGRR